VITDDDHATRQTREQWCAENLKAVLTGILLIAFAAGSGSRSWRHCNC